MKGTFALLLVTALVWLVCVSTSQYLAGTPSPPPGLPEDVSRVVMAADQNPESESAQINAAQALTKLGLERGEPSLIMKAIDRYNIILKSDPTNKAALRGLAELSFESGVFDKAAAYFKQYLLVAPDDSKARVDYALALIQSGEAAQAIDLLQNLVSENANLFPARLTLALAYKVNGQLPEAELTAKEALSVAADDEGRAVVADFIARLKGTASPQTLESYFRDNEVFSQKVAEILPGETFTVKLRDFPVTSMPDFARKKMESNILQLCSGDTVAKYVILLDLASGSELLKIGPCR